MAGQYVPSCHRAEQHGAGHGVFNSRDICKQVIKNIVVVFVSFVFSFVVEPSL